MQRPSVVSISSLILHKKTGKKGHGYMLISQRVVSRKKHLPMYHLVLVLKECSGAGLVKKEKEGIDFSSQFRLMGLIGSFAL